MKLKGITINLPVADVRVFLAPSTRHPFLSPLRAEPGTSYLHGFGVAGDRKLRIPWRPHESLFFDCRGSLSLPDRLPDGNPGGIVTGIVRRLYLDCGAGVRFDFSLFTNPIHSYPPSTGTPRQWIHQLWRQPLNFIDKGKCEYPSCAQALERLVTKFTIVSTPHRLSPRTDLIRPLTPQIVLIVEGSNADLQHQFRVPFLTVNQEQAIQIATEKIALPGTPLRLPVVYIAHPPGYLNRPKPERFLRFEQLRLTRAFLAWLHADLELLKWLIWTAREISSWRPQLLPGIADLKDGLVNMSTAAVPPELHLPTILAFYESRLRLAFQAEAQIQELGAAISSPRRISEQIVERKVRSNEYDCFFCYNREDQQAVLKVAELLKNRSIRPWIDEWDLQPGIPWAPQIENRIRTLKSAVVFVGESGIGPWQDFEVRALLAQFAKRGCPVIPVILPDSRDTPDLPLFLQGMQWVDFRRTEPNPLGQLVYGITGERHTEGASLIEASGAVLP